MQWWVWWTVAGVVLGALALLMGVCAAVFGRTAALRQALHRSRLLTAQAHRSQAAAERLRATLDRLNHRS